MSKMIIKTIPSVDQTLFEKERFNPYQTGHGFYKNKKRPSRAEEKQKLRKEIEGVIE